MNHHITTIVVLGWGDGTLGATDRVEYGTAGIKAGATEYHVDEIPSPESAVQIRDGVGEKRLINGRWVLVHLLISVFCL
jgi:hypothetical protein